MTERRALSAALAGCTIVVAVDRRSGELAAALERHGATVWHAPALTIVPHIDDDALIARTRQLIATPPDVVVVTTGVGFRGWMEAADEAGLADRLHAALSTAQLIARGPKAHGAIQQAGLTADWTAESETAAEVADYLVALGVDGRRVAVQHHGSGSDGLDERLTAHGAEVVSLTVYRWGPPPDRDAVARSATAAAAGDVDAVLFTSAPGASEWLAAARRTGTLDGIRDQARAGHVLLAAVGPITAEPIRQVGIQPLVAERGRLGSLVRSVVKHFGSGDAPALQTVAGRLELRSSGVLLDGRFIALSPTGTEVLTRLFTAAGAVVPRSRLQAALPRSAESPHAVEMAIARVREALGVPHLIRTVVKRGYRLDVIDQREPAP